MRVKFIPCTEKVCSGTVQAPSSLSSYLAAAQPPQREAFQRLWSNASQWSGNEVPADGQDVVISEAWDLLLDISTNSLGLLTVQGRLSFKETT